MCQQPRHWCQSVSSYIPGKQAPPATSSQAPLCAPREGKARAPRGSEPPRPGLSPWVAEPRLGGKSHLNRGRSSCPGPPTRCDPGQVTYSPWHRCLLCAWGKPGRARPVGHARRRALRGHAGQAMLTLYGLCISQGSEYHQQLFPSSQGRRCPRLCVGIGGKATLAMDSKRNPYVRVKTLITHCICDGNRAQCEWTPS